MSCATTVRSPEQGTYAPKVLVLCISLDKMFTEFFAITWLKSRVRLRRCKAGTSGNDIGNEVENFRQKMLDFLQLWFL